jgi:hypothetical protein
MSGYVTLLEMLEELESFGFKSEKKNEAWRSQISTNNSSELSELVDDWRLGIYDEDPGLLFDKLEGLI